MESIPGHRKPKKPGLNRVNEAREKRLKEDLSPRERKQNLWEIRINTWEEDLLI